MTDTNTIRIRPIDEQWQTLGRGRLRGVEPEDIVATANPNGPDSLTFGLKAIDATLLRTDLLPYTPIEYEVDGMRVWAGRVKARPVNETDHSIQCEGWQYYADDPKYSRLYVATKLDAWRDVRQNLNYDLARFITKYGVETGATIKISHPAEAIAANKSAGVLFDAGPDSTVKRIIVGWTHSNNDTNATVYLDSSDTLPVSASGADTISVLTGGASGTFTKTLGTARRYLMIWMDNAAHTPLAEIWFKATSVQLFRDTAYESGNASVLKADVVVEDALTFAPLLNPTTDLIVAGTFNIPEYLTNDYQSPREVIEAINAYENYRWKIGGDDLRSLVFGPKPTAPLYEVGEWSGSQFEDASIAGDEIYSDVYVTGTDAAGNPIVEKRTQPVATLVSKGGGTRTKILPIRSSGTTAVYDRFGDLWLTEHDTAPFSGKLTVTTGARKYQGGEGVPPHLFLLGAGEKINFAHRLDPDTGAVGRVGTIAGVRYTANTKTAEIDIDDRRDHFETILERYGVLTDQIR